MNTNSEAPSLGNVEAAIAQERVKLALKHLPTMQSVSFLVALVLAFSVRASVPLANIALWLALVLAVVLSRIVYYRQYVKAGNDAESGFWERTYVALAFTSGIIWGLSSFLIFPSGNFGLMLLFLLVIASLAAATTVSHSSLRYGPAGWMTPALLFSAARCFIERGETEHLIGVLILIYYAGLIVLSLNHHRNITASIALRFDNLKLLDEVQKSEERFRNLFNSIIDAICIHDESGRILDVNRGAETAYSRPREFFLQKTLEAVSASGMNDLAATAAALQRAFEQGPQLIEFWGGRSDGSAFPQEVRLVPAAYGNRRVVISVARDVSERKRAEAELLRTQKIEMIGVLAGGIAHDFNNLLQSVFGYLAVAKKKINQEEKALFMLEKADAALQMSVKLTTQLLTFSRGGFPVKQTIVLGPVIENAATFALSGSRSRCTFVTDDSLWNVEADDGQLTQVVQNLVLNADQAMPGGGVVTIVMRNADLRASAPATVPGPGKWVEIRIEDVGEGIPQERLSRIFEPYYSTKPNGSGLGLATSYAIIKNHGGMIEVSSIENKGSVFTIWLPASEQAAKKTGEREYPASNRKGRVLIMDDEDAVREAVGQMLEALGHSVEYSADGNAAIEQYRAALAAGSPFSVVILDATVRGGMGGEEAIRTLKQIDPAVVAVIASGYSDNAVVSNYAAHGFRAVLTKPFTLKNLQSVLGSVMA